MVAGMVGSVNAAETKAVGVPTMSAVAQARFWSKVDRRGRLECWNWKAGTNGFGYGVFGYKVAGRRVQWYAHRISASLFGITTAERCILHSCDNPRCVNPEHLRSGTSTDNDADRVLRGRSPHGEGNPCAKLTALAVREIRTRRAAGDKTSYRKLAVEYGVSHQSVYLAATYKTWKRLVADTDV